MSTRYKVQDFYFTQAKQAGLRARSAFKLEEIQKKFRIVKRNDMVLDLGASPGSFLQILSPIVGPKGKIVGVDLKAIDELGLPNVQTFVADIFDPLAVADGLETCHVEQVNVITSDLAPNTSGIRDLDQGRSVLLNEQVLRVAEAYLKKGGNVLMKIFEGADFFKFLKHLRTRFKLVKGFKPKATRGRSMETYLVCTGWKG